MYLDLIPGCVEVLGLVPLGLLGPAKGKPDYLERGG